MSGKRKAKKRPAVFVYVGDWKKDPNLSLCSNVTRAAWWECCLSIEDMAQSASGAPFISGTLESLMGPLRCRSVEEVASVVLELAETETADVLVNGRAFPPWNRSPIAAAVSEYLSGLEDGDESLSLSEYLAGDGNGSEVGRALAEISTKACGKPSDERFSTDFETGPLRLSSAMPLLREAKVTLICRRIYREHRSRWRARLRMAKMRASAARDEQREASK